MSNKTHDVCEIQWIHSFNLKKEFQKYIWKPWYILYITKAPLRKKNYKIILCPLGPLKPARIHARVGYSEHALMYQEHPLTTQLRKRKRPWTYLKRSN